MKRLALVLIVAGCGDDAAAPVDGAPAADAGPASFGRAPATIDVFVNGVAPDDFTSARASFHAEAPPDPYLEASREGSCRRVTSEVPFCDPPCTDGLCTAPNVCSPYPAALAAGPVTLASAGGSRTLAAPAYTLDESGSAFAAGAEVTASAPGGDFPAFSLAETMTAPLVTSTPSATLEAGSPLAIRWTPAAGDARVRMVLIADRGHAQVHPSVIECDVPDAAGEIAVPQAMVDAHADPANWACGDCFASRLVRYRAARATTSAGELELWVGSQVWLYVVKY